MYAVVHFLDDLATLVMQWIW